MDKGIDERSVSGVGDLKIFFQDTVNGFNDGTLSKENFFTQREEFVFHFCF